MLDVEAAAIESAPKIPKYEENIFEVSATERSNGSWTKTSLGPEPSWFCQQGASKNEVDGCDGPSMSIHDTSFHVLCIFIIWLFSFQFYVHYIQCRSIDYTPYNARPRLRSITQDGWGREVLTASHRRPQRAGCGWRGQDGQGRFPMRIGQDLRKPTGIGEDD